jgi:predicted Rossmann-fold nucleotide-binding protein
VVCWGGHSINRIEYDYSKMVGYQMGLRGLDICTGCGPGAMKGPMKGATIAHAKQRRRNTRYIGVTEPGIIAAESPNPIVNHLVIMPDIEKRLEAFVRIGHGIIVFPGGVGTAEEILYLLGILLRDENAALPFPLILTGPAIAAPYFEQIDKFIRLTLGDAAASRYEIIIGDPATVAKKMTAGIHRALSRRIPSSSTGPSKFPRNTSSRSCRPTKRWPHWISTRDARLMHWPRTCGAPSPASSPATSKKTACAASKNSDPSKSMATRK